MRAFLFHRPVGSIDGPSFLIRRWFASAAITICLASPSAAFAGATNKSHYNWVDIAAYGLPVAAGAGALISGDTQGLGQLAVSGGVTFLVTQGLKYGVNEERPDGKGGKAFPSGHAASAFAGAAFIHYRYGWELGLPAEVLASAVAYERVDSGAHHWHDVIAGALIAHASAFAFVDPKNDSVTLLPFIELRKPSFELVAHIKF